jgi:hypothetical protein
LSRLVSFSFRRPTVTSWSRFFFPPRAISAPA